MGSWGNLRQDIGQVSEVQVVLIFPDLAVIWTTIRMRRIPHYTAGTYCQNKINGAETSWKWIYPSNKDKRTRNVSQNGVMIVRAIDIYKSLE